MNTGYKITWSDEANRNVDSIITYREDNWSKKAADDFLAKLKERASLISSQPESFRKSQTIPNARRSVLTPQTTIYYSFDGEEVEILFLFDSRQDPEKLDL